ncbi:MAG TPA: hypothetical protein VEC39_00320 [Vicinamibacterales bacterium]|nr:hypothetical protein [Vicinamibacterales bacterium]
MTPHRDRLDDAIDCVAARLTQVEDDPQLAARLISALPPRRISLRMFSGWAPRLAAIGVVAMVLAYLLTGNPTDVSPGVRALVHLAPYPPAMYSEVAAGVRVEDRSGERANLRARPNDAANDLWNDHERSLESLSLGELAAAELPADEALVVEPLAIADLPLTAESFPAQQH